MIPKLEVDGVSYSYHSLDGETLALSNIHLMCLPGNLWLLWDHQAVENPPC